jgi:hypothetical protein
MITLWFTSTVVAATLTVPGDYPSIDAALLAASPSDLIEVGPGTWLGEIRPTVTPIAIRSTDGSAFTVIGSPDPLAATVSTANIDLTLEGFTIQCTADGGVSMLDGGLTATDLVFSGCSNSGPAVDLSSTSADTSVLVDVVMSDPPTASAAIASTSVNLVLSGVRFGQQATLGGAPLVQSDGGSWTFTDVTVDSVQRTSPLFEGLGLGTANWTRVMAQCSSADGGLAVIDATVIDLGSTMVWKTDTAASPLIELTGQATVRHGTFVGQPAQRILQLNSGSLLLEDSAMVNGGIAVDVVATSTTAGSYNLFTPGLVVSGVAAHAASLSGQGTVTAAPGFEVWLEQGPCDADVLAPGLGSPLLDAGAPGGFDFDGSAADIGATGGPDGFSLGNMDTDFDGSPNSEDCEPNNPDVHPGADDIPYDGLDQDCDGADLTDVDGDGEDAVQVGGTDCDDYDPTIFAGAIEDTSPVDRNCDGFNDPTTSISPVGCTHAPGPLPLSPLWIGLILLFRRR